MKDQRNNDVYNHPQSEDEVNEQVQLEPVKDDTQEQTRASNPNPRANENIEQSTISTNENASSQPGSEITDGEDG